MTPPVRSTRRALLAAIVAGFVLVTATLYFTPPSSVVPGYARTGKQGRGASEPDVPNSAVLEQDEEGVNREVVGQRLELEVVDGEGSAVLDAQILLVQEDRRVPVAETDERGRATIVLSGDELEVLANKDGYSGASAAFPTSADVIQLRVFSGAGEIRGRVLLPGAVPSGPGVTVFAWDATLYEEDAALTRRATQAGAGSPVFNSTTTDNSGAFVLRDLAPEVVWKVVATQSETGLTTLSPLKARTGTNVELQLLQAYGVIARFRDGQGNPPNCSPLLFYSMCTSWAIHDEGGAKAVRNYPFLALLGHGSGRLNEHRMNRWDQLFLYASAEAKDRIGPIGIRFCVPGYGSSEAELWATPLSNDYIPVSNVQLEAETPRWSTLTIQFSGGPANRTEELHTSSWPAFVVFLKPEGQDDMYEFAVRRWDRPIVLEAIPVGRYLLAKREPDFSKAEELWVNDSPSTYTIDMSAFGFLRVDLIDPDGESFMGAAHLVLLNDDGAVYRQDQFHSSPYSFAVNEPGEYTLKLGSPDLGYTQRRPSAQVSIGAGQVLSLSLKGQ